MYFKAHPVFLFTLICLPARPSACSVLPSTRPPSVVCSHSICPSFCLSFHWSHAVFISCFCLSFLLSFLSFFPSFLPSFHPHIHQPILSAVIFLYFLLSQFFFFLTLLPSSSLPPLFSLLFPLLSLRRSFLPVLLSSFHSSLPFLPFFHSDTHEYLSVCASLSVCWSAVSLPIQLLQIRKVNNAWYVLKAMDSSLQKHAARLRIHKGCKTTV